MTTPTRSSRRRRLEQEIQRRWHRGGGEDITVVVSSTGRARARETSRHVKRQLHAAMKGMTDGVRTQ